MGRMPGPHYRNGNSNQRPLFADQLSALNASAAAGVPLIGQSAPRVPVLQFDGFEFPVQDFVSMMPLFEMAYRARRGDQAASATLASARAAMGFGIQDIHKQMYWPVDATTAATETPTSTTENAESINPESLIEQAA